MSNQIKRYAIGIFFLLNVLLPFESMAGNLIHEVFSKVEVDLSAWEEIRFYGGTVYRLKSEEPWSFIHADSQKAASGLIKKEEVDLNRTPYMNWRWRVKKPLPEQSETTKSGDDYSARIYVVFSDGWFFWQTKAINYVWSSRNLKGAKWSNAYAPNNAYMIALQTSSSGVDKWYQEKRNVQADIHAWLDKEVGSIEAIAIMVDTDDSKMHAISEIADIYFSSN